MGAQKTFGNDGYVHYLDYGDCLHGIQSWFICQHVSNCTLSIWQFVVFQLYLNKAVKG